MTKPSSLSDLQVIAREYLSQHSAAACWQYLCQHCLSPTLDFAWHWQLYQEVFAEQLAKDLPAAAVYPSTDTIAQANFTRLMQQQGFSNITQCYQWASQAYSEFWQYVIDHVVKLNFSQAPSALYQLNGNIEHITWLPDAMFNIADACFQADGQHLAICEQAANGDIKHYSYDDLERASNRVANTLVAEGLQSGDVIALMVPLSFMAVAFYLGIIKAGATVMPIAESFSGDAITTRLRIANAKAVIIQDSMQRGSKSIPLYHKLEGLNAPKTYVYATNGDSMPLLRAQDCMWQQCESTLEQFSSVQQTADSLITVLFSSGTTGDPKAIPWTQTTPLKVASDSYFHLDIKTDDILCMPTSLGWMMGPWLVFAALLNRSTMAISLMTPNSTEFCQFIAEQRVSLLGLVPSLVKTWRQQHMLDNIDWQSLRLYFSTGECSNCEDMLFLMAHAGYKPVIEYCGGTEIGGAYITSSIIEPNAPASFTMPAMGLDFVILDDDQQLSTQGEVALIPPSIGLSQQLLNRDHHQVYFADMPTGPQQQLLRRHGDELVKKGHFYQMLGRSDDTMNLGGIKVSSAEIERVINQHQIVYESAAVAVNLASGPSQLVIYVVSNDRENIDLHSLQTELQQMIKQDLNPLFKIQQLIIADHLPRTASNKIMRRKLRDSYYQQNS